MRWLSACQSAIQALEPFGLGGLALTHFLLEAIIACELGVKHFVGKRLMRLQNALRVIRLFLTLQELVSLAG